MRDYPPDDEYDIERMVAVIGAPPAAPMVVVRQQLEHKKATAQHGLFPRLLGVILSRAGQ